LQHEVVAAPRQRRVEDGDRVVARVAADEAAALAKKSLPPLPAA
jgi:hypothetical protein